MCIDPGTMAIAGLAMSAIGTGVSVIGSMQQGKAAQAQANHQSLVQQNNAKLAQMQAADAIARGKEEEQSHRRKVQQMIGQQRAGIAGSGFDLGDDTSLSILGDTAMFGEMDANAIKLNAEREAWGFRQQANNYNAESQLSVMRGDAAKTASWWQAGGDLLSGASKFATSYGSSAKTYGWGT